MEKLTINLTLKIERTEFINFENWLRNELEVIDVKVLPDTTKLYETSSHFKALVKNVKTAQRLRDEFINNHN